METFVEPVNYSYNKFCLHVDGQSHTLCTLNCAGACDYIIAKQTQAYAITISLWNEIVCVCV